MILIHIIPRTAIIIYPIRVHYFVNVMRVWVMFERQRGTLTGRQGGGLGRRPRCQHHLVEGLFQAVLQLRVGHHQYALLVARHELDLLENIHIFIYKNYYT